MRTPQMPKQDVTAMAAPTNGENSSARIDWSAALHTSVTPPSFGNKQVQPPAAPWLDDFLGTKRNRQHDLAKTTGLHIRLP